MISKYPEYRADGVEIKGLTLPILARVEMPFELVMEWTAYLPLEVILGDCTHLLRMGDFGSHQRATGRVDCAIMHWSKIPWIGRDVVVRGYAFLATGWYLRDVKEERPSGSPPFWIDGRPIDRDDVFDAVYRALKLSQLQRRRLAE